MEHIKDLIHPQLILKQSPQEILETYSHIELTDDEYAEAMIWGKQRKAEEIKRKQREKRAEENRKALAGSRWDLNQTKSFMEYRMATTEIFKGKFILDSSNLIIYELLCAYFSDDISFETIAANLNVKNPSLAKGILLAGNFGVGKTWMMKLFTKNQKQVFYLRNAKEIADLFESDGEESVKTFSEKYSNAANDKDCFYQPFSGLCIDDLGTEGTKNHFGNKKNVIGDLIEMRYSKQNTGIFLHATSNLSGSELVTFYGQRVVSRMREIFNFIEVKGVDRRK